MSPRQAIAAAYGEAKAKGYRVPQPNKRPKKLPDASLFGKGQSTDPLDIIAPFVGRAGRTLKKMVKRKAAHRKNPRSLGELMGPVIGDSLLAVEYAGGEGKDRGSIWRHSFKGYGAKVVGLKDGSVLLKRGAKPLWRMFA